MSTDTERNKEVVRAYIGNVINAGLEEGTRPGMDELLRRLERYIAADGYDHGMEATVGPTGEQQMLGLMWAAFPDSFFEILEMIAEDDLITIVGRLTGTNTGSFMALPPTGRKFEVYALQTLRIRDDKIVEHWGGVGMISLLQQVGVFDQVMAGRKAEIIKEMGHQYIEAINNDNFDLMAQLLADDFVDDTVLGPDMPKGVEGVKPAHLMLRTAFPDLRFTIDDLMVEDNALVMVATGHGTNAGSFFGIPATGKEVTWTGMRILHLQGGKFIRGVAEFDQVGILQQMGVVPPLTPPVDIEANKAIIRRLYEEENKGNIDVIDELMAPDIVIHGDALAPLQKGTAGIKQQVAAVQDVFEGLTVAVEDLVAEGDKVTARLRWRGRHVKDFMGIPASGKEITWSAIAVNRIENGRVAERWFIASTFSLLQQLGIIPSMDGGGPAGDQ